jgi:hypothetical protein
MSHSKTMFGIRIRWARLLTIAFLVPLFAMLATGYALAQGKGNGNRGGGGGGTGPKWNMTVIDHASFFDDTRGLDMNQFGQILGRSKDVNGDEELFTCQPDGSITFLNDVLSPDDLDIWQLRAAYGEGAINEVGQLAITARFRNGGSENQPARITLPSSGQLYATVEDLGITPGQASISNAINNFGEVGGASGQGAAYWDPGQPIAFLALPANPRPDSSRVLRVEDSGEMAGEMYVSEMSGQGIRGTRALYWPASEAQPVVLPYIAIGPNNTTYGSASDMNSTGIIVGTSSSGKTGQSTAKRAVTWNLTTGELKNLGSLGGDSYGYSINSSNNVVGFSYTKNFASIEPFYYSTSTGLIALNGAVVNMPSGASLATFFSQTRINDANEILTLVRLSNGSLRPAILRPAQ